MIQLLLILLGLSTSGSNGDTSGNSDTATVQTSQIGNDYNSTPGDGPGGTSGNTGHLPPPPFTLP
ncbi:MULTISPECIES: hypothetical protein [Chryseobacterium]|uniref:hypothetical protein n=1 Tax=Chryseobacterium TaxID=59732 RepID=UPI000F4D8BFE|nr:hypothetical protein [Chryseobacterium piscicola]